MQQYVVWCFEKREKKKNQYKKNDNNVASIIVMLYRKDSWMRSYHYWVARPDGCLCPVQPWCWAQSINDCSVLICKPRTLQTARVLSRFLLTPRKECAFCSTLSIPVSTNHKRGWRSKLGAIPTNMSHMVTCFVDAGNWQKNYLRFSGHKSETHLMQSTLVLTSASWLTIGV